MNTTSKIRYRLVYNYANHLNKYNQAPISLECRQDKKRIYISSSIFLDKSQWNKGKVINHDNAEKLTVYLTRWRNEIEEIELDALLKGRQMTLHQLKDAIKQGMKPNASLKEFTEYIIENSNRKKSTRQGYRYMVNEIEKDYGKLTLNDITYDWIERWRYKMRNKSISENTIKGRLKLLRCVMQQAKLRKLIDDNPFDNIKIGNMTARVGYLTMKEVNKLERIKLEGKEEKVRDLFLLSCYLGLRWSDLSTLEEATIEKGILHKKMKKTSRWVHLPIDTLFWGRGREILDKYPNIKDLSHCCCGTTANRTIKDIAARVGIKKNVFFHLGRKSCSSILNSLGMSVQDISSILGHVESRVTERHYIFDKDSHVGKIVCNIFKKRNKNDS